MKWANMLTKWAWISLFFTPLFTQTANAQQTLPISTPQHAFIWSSSTGMTDIGTLGGNSSYAFAVNDSGEVAGWSYLADNVTTHAFSWTAAGGMVDLGTLSGGCCSQGQFINSAGNVVGDAISSSGLQTPFYQPTGTTMVGMGVFTGNQLNFAFGINDMNQVTGQVYSGEVVHAFLWQPGSTVTLLGHLPGGLHSVGTAINNSADIVGTASTPSGSFISFYWSLATGMHSIGSIPGGMYTAAEGINDAKQVVGWGYANAIDSASSAFYWSASTLQQLLSGLGGDQTFAWGINKAGMIAGHSALTGDTATHAVLWSSYTSAPADLGTLPGGTNSYARGLNNVGQVVGYADVP